MQTTMLGLGRLDYPKDRFRVVAIPNEDDLETVSHLLLLADEFSFLEVKQVPPTSNQKWNIIWQAWEREYKCNMVARRCTSKGKPNYLPRKLAK